MAVNVLDEVSDQNKIKHRTKRKLLDECTAKEKHWHLNLTSSEESVKFSGNVEEKKGKNKLVIEKKGAIKDIDERRCGKAGEDDS